MAHSVLAPEIFDLKDVMKDIFGKNGSRILLWISSGKTVGQIVESLSQNIRKKW